VKLQFRKRSATELVS